MRLVADVGQGSLAKAGEELCGDRVEVVRDLHQTTVVLSDGLGSGVKANILATLTTKIAAGLLARGVSLEEVIGTIAQTLPVCRERHLAYSTLAVLEVRTSGEARVMLLDSPPVFLVRRDKVVGFPTRTREVAGRRVEEGSLELVPGDVLVLVSDGVLHAGIGGLLPLGLGEEGLAKHLSELVPRTPDAGRLAQSILDLCNAYYTLAPGDDTTVVVLRVREPRFLTLFTGPPRSPAADAETVDRFMRSPGKKVVCGGTTAKIVARELGRPLTVELTYDDPEIPPCGHIPGIDLVTEGMLTLNRALSYLRTGEIPDRADGASRVARLLAEADQIKIVAGLSVNPAHQNPDLPPGLNLRAGTVEKLAAELKAQGRLVQVEWC